MFVVNYEVVNIGESTATDIEIYDLYNSQRYQKFHQPIIELKIFMYVHIYSFANIENINDEGEITFNPIEALAPGERVSFQISVIPKLHGIYESTRARVKYNQYTVEMDDIQEYSARGHSSSLGRVKIISKVDNERNTSYFFLQWSLFAVIYSVPTILPFYWWTTLVKSRK